MKGGPTNDWIGISIPEAAADELQLLMVYTIGALQQHLESQVNGVINHHAAMLKLREALDILLQITGPELDPQIPQWNQLLPHLFSQGYF